MILKFVKFILKIIQISSYTCMFTRNYQHSGQKGLNQQVKPYRPASNVPNVQPLQYNTIPSNRIKTSNNNSNFPASKLNYYHKKKTQQLPTLSSLMYTNFNQTQLILQCNKFATLQTHKKQPPSINKTNLYQNHHQNTSINPSIFPNSRVIPLLSNRNPHNKHQSFLSNNNNKQNMHMLGNYSSRQGININIIPSYNVVQNQQQSQCYQQQNQQFKQEVFVFNPKTYCSGNNAPIRKSTFEETFRNFERERSNSRSNSKRKDQQFKFVQEKKVKSEIRIGTINPQSILGKLNQNSNGRFSAQKSRKSRDYSEDLSCNQDSQIFNQGNYGSRRAVQGSVLSPENNNHLIINQPNNQINSFNHFQNTDYQRRKQSQFSFQRRIPSYQQPIINVPLKPSSALRPITIPLHTIQQVQQSIKSVQLPPTNQLDFQINRKITEHFEEIKQNMLKQLLMRSKEGKHFDNQSMSLIVDELQQAANNIMKKYCQKQVVVSVKGGGNGLENSRLEFSITESQKRFDNKNSINSFKADIDKFNHMNQISSKTDSVIPPLQADVCGSDQKQLVQRCLPLKSYQKDYLNLYADKKLQNIGLRQSQSSNQIQKQVNTPKQINILTQNKMKSLKYQQASKDNSSISSINQDSSSLNMNNLEDKNANYQQKVDDINKNNKVQQVLGGNSKNRDSIKAELQNLNKYTFLKSHKPAIKVYEKLYTYQEKQLSQKDYKVQQSHTVNGEAKVYTVKYDVKFLNQPQRQERKPTEVFRLSPFKFKKKEQVIQQMVKNNFIARESQSFIIEESNRV